MELTSAHLEAIKEAARAVEYGSVTLTISANAKTLDLIVENRVRIKKEPGGEDAAEGEEGQGSDGNSDAPVGEDDGSGKQKNEPGDTDGGEMGGTGDPGGIETRIDST